MWIGFQTAVVVILGDGILIVAAFALAGGVLLGMLHVALGTLRRLI